MSTTSRFGIDPAVYAEIIRLAASGASDAVIDREAVGGESLWSTRYASYEARVEAGLYPDRRGTVASIEAVREADVRSVVAEAPRLRAAALPAVFGFEPTKANIDRLGSYRVAARRPGRLASGRYRATA